MWKGGEMGMTDTPYNMPPLGLFGKRCRILTGYDKRPFVYRIVNSEWMSNTWCEPPITYQSKRNPVRHDHSENVLIVVLDTLIDEKSSLIRVALKDVELMDETHDNAGWISVRDRMPENNKDVLICGEWKGVSGTKYREIFLSCMEDFIYQGYTPIAWMPLPEPPKEEGT
jgi:hypothetical protein